MAGAPEASHRPITMAHSLPLNDDAVVEELKRALVSPWTFGDWSVGEEPASGSPRGDLAAAPLSLPTFRGEEFSVHAIRLALGPFGNRSRLTDTLQPTGPG